MEMNQIKKHSSLGIASLLLSIISIVLIFLVFILMFLGIGDTAIYIFSIFSLLLFILPLVAIILGAIAYFGKDKDIFGLAGFIIGIVIIVTSPIAMAATTYVYVSGQLSPMPESAPSIAWTVDRDANTVTITFGSSGDTYGTISHPNLIFKQGNTEYYVNVDYNITTEGNYCTNNIIAGDLLSFEDEGTYSVIWYPTDKLIGEITL